MKTVRKAVIAASVAAALAPATSMADTTLFGYLDVAIGVEQANQTALAFVESPALDNVIGIEGEQELENGHSVTYQYVANVQVIEGNAGGGSAFGANYHSYVGYKINSHELRIGNQDLPLRLALDKADLFTGTYADQNNIIGGAITGVATVAGTGTNLPGNSTSTNTLMLVGGGDTVSYAASISNPSEASNGPQSEQFEELDYGAMVNINLSDSTSIAVGYQGNRNIYEAYGATANIGLSDSITLNAGVHYADGEGALSGSTLNEYIIGAAFAVTDKLTLKAQHVESDATGVSASQAPNMYAIGADYTLSDNVTAYALFASGNNGGLNTTGELEDGSHAQVTAVGLQVGF